MFTSLSSKVLFVICVAFCAAASAQAQSLASSDAGTPSGSTITSNAVTVSGDNTNMKETVLTKSESKRLTRVLCKCFTSNKHMYPLQRYNRQYVAYVNGNGEKEVLVNCYYKRSETHLAEAKLPGTDGKQSYFRATINLHTMQAQDFGFHESPIPAGQDMSLK
jgi:hypothetical protein